jgi:hypothetical protein
MLRYLKALRITETVVRPGEEFSRITLHFFCLSLPTDLFYHHFSIPMAALLDL